MKRFLGLGFVAAALLAGSASAQETGSIAGTVRMSDGQPVPGTTVTARSNVLPQARTTRTTGTGDFLLPLLPPGTYDLTFELEGMQAETRRVAVPLEQRVTVDVTMGMAAVEETIQVVGEGLIDPTSSEIKSTVAEDVIEGVPTGQEYRDLVKLIPGVQYTEDATRGPSAGGSGQDNVYKFDGVNVTRPLFGTLSAEPSSHDIEQLAIVKGGADATDFNRSGGFTINSISKSGTNEFNGEVSYQVQTDGMTGDRDTGSGAEFEEDRDWTVAALGGPIVPERLFFYASYYRPTISRDNRSNFYGEVPDFDSERDEYFGKLSYSPTDTVLLRASYRDSDRSGVGESVGEAFDAGSTAESSAAQLEVAILEGTWVINPESFLSFEYTDFAEENASVPDRLFGFPVGVSQRLDVASLDQQGLFRVPTPIPGNDAYNAFIQPLIERYGFLQDGQRVGGGLVGGASTINDQDFFRESFAVGYDYLFDGNVSHEVHVGYQRYTDEEDLARFSNGWGLISVPDDPDVAGAAFVASIDQMSLSGELAPPINSQFESQNFEINDTIRWNDLTFNVGVLASNDELFGQGLRPNSSNVSGFELAPGHRYKMYEIDFEDQIQPRLGATWAYNGRDTVFANYARYHPAASSLPRAASWARNLRTTIEVFFDDQGNVLGTEPIASSSGKFFQPDMNPRSIDEFLVGTAQQWSRALTLRAHARYRYAHNFWEDTNNTARVAFEPPSGVPREPYIPDLGIFRDEVGGSSYVIAELDGAFTKYWEASLDADWRGDGRFVRASYVWSHYYGNFDQDNTTTDNDADVFIGSSFLADGAGRQIWDSRYGDLRGDRRHQLKLYGYQRLPWDASVGAFAIYQSGQPWEAWSVLPYRHLTGSSSNTSRFAESAGSRRTSDHYQLDLNYTQSFFFGGGAYEIELRGDVFNVFDKQTGYDVEPVVPEAGFGQPREFYDPRRFQLAVAFRF